MGKMMEHLKQEETSHSSSDLLKICVKIGASWSAQALKQEGEQGVNYRVARGSFAPLNKTRAPLETIFLYLHHHVSCVKLDYY